MKTFVFIIINLFALSLLLVKGKRQVNLWLAGYLSFYSLGLFVSIIDPLPKTIVVERIEVIELIARFLSALSFRLSPWLFVCTYLSLSTGVNKKQMWYRCLLAPIILSYLYDFFCLKDSWVYVYLDYSRQFWTLGLWVLPYTIIGNFLMGIEIYKKYLKANLKRKKIKNKLLKECGMFVLALANFPLYYYVYLNPILIHIKHDFTIVTTIFGSFVTIIFLYFVSTIGFCGIKVNLLETELEPEPEPELEPEKKKEECEYSFDEVKEQLSKYHFIDIKLKIIVDILNNLSSEDSAYKNSIETQTVRNYKYFIFKKMKIKNSKQLKELINNLRVESSHDSNS